MNKQQGLALITTLWLVALLLLMTMTFSRTMHTEAKMIKHSLADAQSEQLAESGIWMALQLLLDSYDGQPSNLESISQTLAERENNLSIYIQDHNGLIDLNYAPPELIQAALLGLGWNTFKAETLSHQIIDWRDKDHDKHRSGAEDMDYRAKGRADGAKDRPFNSVEEIRLLLDVSESDYQAIASLFTVYSQQRSVNTQLSPEMLYQALQPVQQRQSSPVNDVESMSSSWFNERTGRVLSISSRSALNNHISHLEAVILLHPDQYRQYAILAWRQGGPNA